MTHRFSVVALLSGLFIALPLAAQADMGRVGGTGKVTVMNAERQPAYHPPAEPKDGALLVIRFNLHHVYYERALMEAIESTRQVKPGAMYRIVNTVPVGNSPSQTDRIAKDAQSNLQAVMQQMQSDGVAPAQMSVETATGEAGSAQEVQIFVK